MDQVSGYGTHTRRVGNKRLIAEAERRHIPLTAERAVHELLAMIKRTEIVPSVRRKPTAERLQVSMLEYDVLTQCLVLFELKVSMQRGEMSRSTRDC